MRQADHLPTEGYDSQEGDLKRKIQGGVFLKNTKTRRFEVKTTVSGCESIAFT